MVVKVICLFKMCLNFKLKIDIPNGGEIIRLKLTIR